MVRVRADGIRLALFTDTALPQLNGVSRTLARLVDTVRERGGAVRVFTTTDPNATPAEAVRRYASIPFWAYPQLRLAWPRASSVREELDDWKPTLIHAATPFGVGVAARQAARALSIPFVTSYHTSFSAYADFYRLGALAGLGWRFIRWFHNGGLRTYCPTHAIERELGARGFTNTAVWGRGVDAKRFNPSWRSQELRSALGADGDTVFVVYVGRLAAEKGLDTALDAMQRVRAAAGARVAFAFAGDGPYAAHCRQYEGDGCSFVGRLEGEALSEFFASGDVFIFPSATDTFGNVLLEAMASGLPIVAADSPPTREVMGGVIAASVDAERRYTGGDIEGTGELTGILVPAGNGEVMAQAILSLANDPRRRHELAEVALRESRRRSWDAVFDRLFEDYRRVTDFLTT